MWIHTYCICVIKVYDVCQVQPLCTFLQNIPIAWANQAVFDYACNLKTGICDLYMWPVHEELSDSLHYMGTTVLNSATHDTVCLKVEISTPQDIPEDHPPIMFPSREIVHRVNASVSQRRFSSVRYAPTHSPAILLLNLCCCVKGNSELTELTVKGILFKLETGLKPSRRFDQNAVVFFRAKIDAGQVHILLRNIGQVLSLLLAGTEEPFAVHATAS